MKLTNELFIDLGDGRWDLCVKSIKGYSHMHLAYTLDYYLKHEGVRNLSFEVLEGGECLAIVPLALSKNTLSFGDLPCPSPLVKNNLKESKRRKIFNYIFEIIDDFMRKNNAKKYISYKHPFQSFYSDAGLSGLNLFELQRYFHDVSVNDALIMDLAENVDSIELGFSKYHRRNIKKSEKLGVQCKAISDDDSLNDIDYYFNEFRAAHFLSSGRETRSNDTWIHMKERIVNGLGNLFVAKVERTNISYLYCGNVDGMAWGWSQVNVKEFERMYMPRHLLEWEAMKYYKRKGEKVYDLGDRLNSTDSIVYSPKELSISDFKEKYGTPVYPKIFYKRFLKDDEGV